MLSRDYKAEEDAHDRGWVKGFLLGVIAGSGPWLAWVAYSSVFLH